MAIDVSALLEPVSPDAASGENLEYDPRYLELELAAEEKPEQQFGDTVVPAEPPDWDDVAKRSLELLRESKDLRLAILLTRASLHSEGLNAFRDGLALIKGMLDQYWDTLHPQLDPDDDLDPTARVNLAATLCNSAATLAPLRNTALLRVRSLGYVCLRDLAVIAGTDAARADPDRPALKQSDVDALVEACDPEVLADTATAARESLALSRAIEDALAERVGTGNAIDMSDLTSVIKDANSHLSKWSAARAPAPDLSGAPPQELDAGEPGAAPAARTVAAAPRAGVNSRDDVLKALDEVCAYFERFEPSSPVPILLLRAKRLVTKDFLGILEDLLPDAMPEAEKLRGPSS